MRRALWLLLGGRLALAGLAPAGLALAGLALTGCGGAPKPVELVAYEHRSRAQYESTLNVRQPELLARSRAAHQQAIAAWRRKDADAVIHYTRLADIYWRTAEALSHTKDLKDAQVAYRRQAAQHAQSRALAEERLSAVDRDIRRLERLSTLRSELVKVKRTARQQKQADAARRQIDEAMKQMRTAESLDAERHAAGALNKARQSLQNAFDAFNAGRYADAGAAAGLAESDAVAAAAQAQPAHDAEAEQRTVDGELRKMLEEIAGAPWADARISKRGLVVSLRELFARKKARLGRTIRVEPVIALAKGYPRFSIVVEGHTDNRGPPEENAALGTARAKAIAQVITDAGVEKDRLRVSGKGDAEPVADNSTLRGRALNRRVDVVFLRPTVVPGDSGDGALIPSAVEPQGAEVPLGVEAEEPRRPVPIDDEDAPGSPDVVDTPAEPMPDDPVVKPPPTPAPTP